MSERTPGGTGRPPAQLPDHARGPGRPVGLAGRAGHRATQLRSLGLLKLFFTQLAGPGDIAELAKVQTELHRQTVDYTREIIERLKARGDLPGQLAVAELMGDALRVMGDHWERIGRAIAEPPAPAAAARGR